LDHTIHATDVPVTSKKDDGLNIGKYVNGLADFIQTCDTPLNISIQGDWGSGKTSFINMIMEQLDQNASNVKTIYLNTWLYSQFNTEDVIVYSILQALIDAIYENTPGANELSTEEKFNFITSKLGQYLILSGHMFLERYLGSYGHDEIVKKIRQFRHGECSEDILEALDYSNALQDFKAEFAKAVNNCLGITDEETEESGVRLAIFIDDLDRLNPAKAVEILEAFKNFMDCEHCVFILAVDYNIVTSGIQAKYGDNVTSEKGKSFFDKLIQLPFNVPVASYDIDGYLAPQLQAIWPDETDSADFTRLVYWSIGTNPRNMKRLMNSVRLLNAISEEPNKGDPLYHRILFASTCLQMRFPEAYDYIALADTADEVNVLFQDPDSPDYPIQQDAQDLHDFMLQIHQLFYPDSVKQPAFTPEDFSRLTDIMTCVSFTKT